MVVMPETSETQRANDLVARGDRAGIPVTEDHARMAAKSSDSLYDAYDAVRSIDYQDHEPSNVFNPVVLDDASDGGIDR
jgi:hypothetical protein